MSADPKRVQAVYLDAAELSPTERPAFLDGECGPDAELRTRVEALLRAGEGSGDLLGPPDAGRTGTFAPDSARNSTTSTLGNRGETACHITAPGAGTILAGRYKLIEAICEGGMGTVFMAQQTEPVKRLVAVKVIKSGMDSRTVLARFEAERQALAMMDHPNIAKVLDAGVTDTNRPYFVMELVKGVPITKFCDDHKLTSRQRLELFVPVCQAIQHAHQKGVIHRDVKPNNVLVAMYDDRPVPKVIDFGVAKATGPQLTDHTLVTGFGAVVGTPEYMSPEQASFNQMDVDTRSDVYSLGMLLYELLTGTTPIDRKRLGKATVLEVLQVIREQEPPKPSTRVSTDAALPSIAANRNIDPIKLKKLIRGELDWIVMKALEKDRSRRYETANGLAADGLRYLGGEAVLAHPPSAAYRIHKLVRRNKKLIATAGAFAAVLVLGTVLSAWQAVRAMNSEARAVLSETRAVEEREIAQNAMKKALAADAENRRLLAQLDLAVNTLYQVFFEMQNQLRDRPDLEKLREKLLKEALGGLEAVAKSAENANLLQRTSGGAYQRMGDVALEMGKTPDAMGYYERALRIYEQLTAIDPNDDRNPWSLAVMYDKVGAVNHRLGGDVNNTRDFYHRATEIRKALANKQSRSDARLTQVLVDNALAGSYAAEANLALLMGNPALALQYFQSALPLRQKLAVANAKDLQAQEALATLYVAMGQAQFHLRNAAESEHYYRHSLAIRESLTKADRDSVPFKKGLVDVHQKIGDMLLHLKGKEALDTIRDEYKTAHGLQTELFNQNPSSKEIQRALASSFYRLGTVVARAGDKPESQKDFLECMKLREVLAKDDPTNLYKQAELALAQARCGEVEKAAAAAKRFRTDAAKDSNILYYFGCCFALCASATDEPAKRAEYAREAVATFRQAIARGYDDRVSLETNPDLESLQEMPEYKELLRQLKQH
jgi:serine/threonine protein kinase/tetratricopeptide (TPR) repeat protein